MKSGNLNCIKMILEVSGYGLFSTNVKDVIKNPDLSYLQHKYN